MAVNTDPLYNTPDTPDVDTFAVIPPSPQLQPLADLVQDPVGYTQANPKLQVRFREPLKQTADADSLFDSTIANIHKNVNKLPYNRFDKNPIQYDKKLQAAYDDPELGFIPGRDNESFYDAHQSWYGDIGRNFLGFSANLAGTALQTLVNTPITVVAVANWAVNGFDSESFSKAYDNPISRTVSDWMDDVQSETYNYRGEREQQVEKSPLLNMIPFYGNGFGDAMRSLGFGLGAAAGIFAEEAIVTALTGGTGTAPALAAQLSRLYRIGQKSGNALNIGRAASNIEQLRRAVEVGGNIERGLQTAWAGKLGARNVLSSLGEATFEALETQKHLELDLIQKYRDENGVNPSQEELDQIKKATIEAGNARYLLNVALLTATNAIEFDALFKTFPVSKYFKNEAAKVSTELGERGFQQAARETAQAGESSWFKTFTGRAGNVIKSNAIIAPTEGIEEGLQNVIDQATSYYAEHKFKGREENVGILDATVEGFKNTLTTSEGWNAILQGMVAGGVQQVATNHLTNYLNRGRLTQDEIGSRLLQGLNPLFTDSEGNTDYNAVKTLLNINSIGGTAQNKVDHAASMAGAQKAAKRAVVDEDQQAFQTYKDDIQFTFLNQFIRTNQYEALDDILDSWTELAIKDPAAFQKQFGLEAPYSNPSSVVDSIDKLRKKGEKLKRIYDDVHLNFNNPFPSKTEPYDQYERYKTELTNQLYKYDRFSERYSDLEQRNVGFNHLQVAFKDKEFKQALKRERKGIQDQLSIPDPEGSTNDIFAEARRNLESRLKAVDRLEEYSRKRKELTEAQVLEMMDDVDDVFSPTTSSLRSRVNKLQVINDVADMIRLKTNSDAAIAAYQKLIKPEGFEAFKEIENKAEEVSAEERVQQQNAKRQEKEKKEKEETLSQQRQTVQSNFADQFNDLAGVTGKTSEELRDEFLQTGAQVNKTNIDAFVMSKLKESAPPAPTPIEGQEDESEESYSVDDDEQFFFSEDDLLADPVVVDPLDAYRTGQKSLNGKFIRYISGSQEGTTDYRYIKNVTSQSDGRIRADVIEFEDGVAVDKGNKEFNLADPNKFTDVQENVGNYRDLIKQLLAPPIVPPVQPQITEGPKSKPIPLAYFQQFFTTDDTQRANIFRAHDEIGVNITRFPVKVGKGVEIFNNGVTVIRSAKSQNLSAGKDEVFSFELDTPDGSLGFFRPLSSFMVSTGGKEESLYDIVGRSFSQPNELDKISTAITGTVKDLQTAYKLEEFLKAQAKAGKENVSLNNISEVIGHEIFFKPYYRGVTYARTDDSQLPTLGQLRIDRSQAFIWEDTQKYYPFNETDPNLDYTEALQRFSNLFTEDGFTQSTLSSYLLFFKDSTGAWNTVPVRTIPITSKGVGAEVKSIEDQVKAFEGTDEDLVKLLNSKLFYQSNIAKGNFVFSKGKIQFLLQSLMQDSISYADEKANPKDAQQIRITTPINKTDFSVESFFESIKPKVEEINKKGKTAIDFKLDDFRIQPIVNERSIANDFDSYRVMVKNNFVFDTVTMGYGFESEKYKAPKQEQTDTTRTYAAQDLPKSTPGSSFKSESDVTLTTNWNVGDQITFFAERERKGFWDGKSIREIGSNNPWGVRGILGAVNGWLRNEGQSVLSEVVDPQPTIQTPDFQFDPVKMTKADAEQFFKTYPDEKSQLGALRREHKMKAKQVLEQIQLKLGQKLDITSAEGINRIANQQINPTDIFRNSDEEFVPSLKLDNSQLNFLVQKALRECK